ncbi:hypothetical protein [Methanoregula sp.]|uniref:hypothetical protein n=1 Tax=Methanoregula sp. TaxID=2052170 RepID=UPI00236D9132|nr:hypothetical protein [Methanoregula sp.]MDD1687529.1 hypothetical protein [Methanoregula sp.]
MNPMNRFLLCGCLLLLLVVLPASASPMLVSQSFTPNPPLVPGGQEQVVATFAIPSGTSFPKTHNLQMQTSLENARWNIQVILDGNNAAQQTASGSAAFINGEILSYSINRDVSFTVTIAGTVPASATGTVTVLDLVEIDNTGNVVPGSEILISQPVAGATVAPVQTTVPTLTLPPVTTAPPVTKSPGFSVVIALLGCCTAGLAWMRRRQ